MLTTEQQKWIEKIATFDLEITHKKGKDNVVAEALSQKDEEMPVCTISVLIPDWLDDIRTEFARNLHTCAIINKIGQNSKFAWKNDILCYKGLINLPSSSKFKLKTLKYIVLQLWDV
jgi:hypothetical protein